MLSIASELRFMWTEGIIARTRSVSTRSSRGRYPDDFSSLHLSHALGRNGKANEELTRTILLESNIAALLSTQRSTRAKG
jgi:hypothetical protein